MHHGSEARWYTLLMRDVLLLLTKWMQFILFVNIMYVLCTQQIVHKYFTAFPIILINKYCETVHALKYVVLIFLLRKRAWSLIFIFLAGWMSTTRAVPLVMFHLATFLSILNTIEKYPVVYLKYACAVTNINQLSIVGKLIKFG